MLHKISVSTLLNNDLKTHKQKKVECSLEYYCTLVIIIYILKD